MKPPIIYLYFHSKILDWKGKEMTDKEFKSCFFQWRIPKNLRQQVLEEMNKIGLIEYEKKRNSNGNVFLNDFYFEENNGKVNFKDKDTKKENPYLDAKKLDVS